MNAVHLTGRLAGEPRNRRPAGRQATTTIRVAMARRAGEGDGLVYVDVVSYGSLAEVVGDQLRRGHLVAVTGRLEERDVDEGHDHRSPHFVVASQIDFLQAPAAASR